jgi:nickel/cobalt exporter
VTCPKRLTTSPSLIAGWRGGAGAALRASDSMGDVVDKRTSRKGQTGADAPPRSAMRGGTASYRVLEIIVDPNVAQDRARTIIPRERPDPRTDGVSGTTPALIAAAAGVGFGHAILPDHWMPLAVVGRAQRYPLARIARLSGLAGIAHVLVSLLLGAVIVAVGLQFRSSVADAEDAIVGGLLIATGVAFAVFELARRAHHGHDHPHAGRRVSGAATVMVPFGAAASPDLTILPIFLAAAATGVGAAIGSLVAFALVTVATFIVLTVLAAAGGYALRAPWLDRAAGALTAAVLVVIGALVATGVI